MRVRWLAWVLLALPTLAQAWWHDDWQFRKELIIDTGPTGYAISEQMTDVPVLVRLHLGNFGYFGDVLPNGEDLRFVAADDTTPLPFHIEKFDPVAQIGFVWVKVPNLMPGQAVPMYMYYGNAEVPSGGDSNGVYDRDQTLVINFDQAPMPLDKTAYGNRLRANTAAQVPNGIVGSGVIMDGSNLVVAGSPSLNVDPQKGWTASLWVKVDQTQQDASLIELVDAIAGPENAVRVSIADLSLVYEFAGQQMSASRPLSQGVWHHVSLIISSSSVVLLVDGEPVIESELVPGTLSGDIHVGSSGLQKAGLSGVLLDELRIARVARSAQWTGLSAHSVSLGARLLQFGEDATRDEPATEGHFLTTLRNVEWAGLEGWVIVICVFMAIFSWYVMVTKAISIRRIRRDNQEFIEAFEQQESLDELVGQGDWSASTLAQLYERGMSEIDQRLGKSAPIERASAGAAVVAGLTTKNVDAIKSSMNATNVRISQSLNQLMVLLTLAIAGGPFLGLLGTVVGVMITFAGIAASGDVNINAIAPGVAAALVATIAGLGVAIPALFGYNYLSSRMKEIITDNNVFLEEFISRTTETYVGEQDAG